MSEKVSDCSPHTTNHTASDTVQQHTVGRRSAPCKWLFTCSNVTEHMYMDLRPRGREAQSNTSGCTHNNGSSSSSRGQLRHRKDTQKHSLQVFW